MNAAVHSARLGAVTTITLHRPECRNAVDGPTAVALREAFEAFEADADARVAVLTGGGGQFCAGADLKALGDPGRRNPLEPTGTAPGPMGPTSGCGDLREIAERARIADRESSWPDSCT